MIFGDPEQFAIWYDRVYDWGTPHIYGFWYFIINGESIPPKWNLLKAPSDIGSSFHDIKNRVLNNIDYLENKEVFFMTKEEAYTFFLSQINAKVLSKDEWTAEDEVEANLAYAYWNYCISDYEHAYMKLNFCVWYVSWKNQERLLYKNSQGDISELYLKKNHVKKILNEYIEYVTSTLPE